MTPVQEADINNALLTLMYEWKTGMIDQVQALKEFKQCLKYYSRMEDVIRLEYSDLVDERRIDHYGLEKTVEYLKKSFSEIIAKMAIDNNCFFFEEVDQIEKYRSAGGESYRKFRIKMEAIIQKQTP